MRFEIFKDRKGEWRWRLIARNGRIVADGAEGYASKRNALRAVKTVARGARIARIDVLE